MDGEEPEARRLLGNDQMKRYVVISQMTPRGPEYRIYDRVNEATVDDSQDPDDMCVHCHAMIVGYYFRKCPFCGRIWWKFETN